MHDSIPQIPAVVLAGGTLSHDDPLAAYAPGLPKSLIPIAGRPMVAYVISALAGSRYVPFVAVVGLDDLPGESFPVPVDFLPAQSDILANAESGLRHAAAAYPAAPGVLLASSDIPLITPQIVDARVEAFLETDHDVHYSAVERSVMEARFPGSARSYAHLRDADFAGGDLSLLHPTLAMGDPDLWHDLTEARKSVLRLARLIGLGTVLLLITRRLSLTDAERRASKALGIRGRVVPSPHAEVGMDVDKPFQLEIVRAELEARELRPLTPE